ncbi:unnamed protein product [Prorocentrum cordatum]|uniref:Uncharacterized protein n=1 Tax=Prorocentrum cordatum TaxID=2364126 RepID=A0ABN9SYN7_9DINO|nr:unnamed protein product [Polarella glacialis]
MEKEQQRQPHTTRRHFRPARRRAREAEGPKASSSAAPPAARLPQEPPRHRTTIKNTFVEVILEEGDGQDGPYPAAGRRSCSSGCPRGGWDRPQAAAVRTASPSPAPAPPCPTPSAEGGRPAPRAAAQSRPSRGARGPAALADDGAAGAQAATDRAPSPSAEAVGRCGVVFAGSPCESPFAPVLQHPFPCAAGCPWPQCADSPTPWGGAVWQRLAAEAGRDAATDWFSEAFAQGVVEVSQDLVVLDAGIGSTGCWMKVTIASLSLEISVGSASSSSSSSGLSAANGSRVYFPMPAPAWPFCAPQQGASEAGEERLAATAAGASAAGAPTTAWPFCAPQRGASEAEEEAATAAVSPAPAAEAAEAGPLSSRAAGAALWHELGCEGRTPGPPAPRRRRLANKPWKAGGGGGDAAAAAKVLTATVRPLAGSLWRERPDYQNMRPAKPQCIRVGGLALRPHAGFARFDDLLVELRREHGRVVRQLLDRLPQPGGLEPSRSQDVCRAEAAPEAAVGLRTLARQGGGEARQTLAQVVEPAPEQPYAKSQDRSAGLRSPPWFCAASLGERLRAREVPRKSGQIAAPAPEWPEAVAVPQEGAGGPPGSVLGGGRRSEGSLSALGWSSGVLLLVEMIFALLLNILR